MANQTLGLGSAANDGTGDTLRAALDKVNDNFLEIYTLIGDTSDLTTGISATASVVTLTAPTITGVVGGTQTSATITTLATTTVNGTTLNGGTLALAAGSITDSSGAISFGNENLTTTGTITGALATAAQTAITSVGTLTALQVDNININGNAITSTAGTDLTITPLSGQQIVLDGTIVIDAGVVTGATSITSTAFVGDITGDVTGNADTATTLATARTIGGTSFDGSANIAVALSATATALATARTIGGTSFDGTANIAVALASVGTAVTVADESSDTTCFPLFTTAATGDLPPKSGTNLTFNSSSGLLTATLLAGDLTGDVTGTADVATVATTVTITDNESTNESNALIFTAGGDVDGGNLGLESDGTLTYNPSTGIVTATGFAGALTGNVTGNASGTALTVTQAAQSAITSVGTLTALTVDDVAVDGKVITMTGSSGDTFVTTVAANGATSLVTTDASAAAANFSITADGTVDIDSAGVLTLDSGAAINIEPAVGSAILLDGTISIDAGVVTGATSITSTAFVGDITGDVTGTADVATVATTVTITDNESTNENNAIIFTAGGDVDGGNIGLESDGTLTYNPSTGKITATGFVGALTGNVTGNLAGTVTTATQNSITTATGLVSVGALDSGSITSGFTSIDVGAGAISTTGTITYGALNDGTTALGATAAELNILDASAGNTAVASDVASSAGAVTSNNFKISHTLTLAAELADDAEHADVVITSDKCLATSTVIANASIDAHVDIHTVVSGSFKVRITNKSGGALANDSTMVLNYTII
jgi:hypothetical protein